MKIFLTITSLVYITSLICMIVAYRNAVQVPDDWDI